MVDFVDRCVVHLRAGKGGNGCASIRREKFKPLAGPNGGNGGSGGSIYFHSSKQSTSLLDYHFNSVRKADSGSMGMGGDKDGVKGADLHLQVPIGTVVKTGSGKEVFDFIDADQEFLVCRGGTGGFGNARLASSVRKAPGFALLGTPGQECDLTLELKLLADVALVGYPSAGKSSIIAAISAARPKIADYPFTTLVPNLGVVNVHGNVFTVADVPGLIEGASEGKGLGLEFLRHVERTKVLVHIIDCATYEPGRDPITDYEKIVEELKQYDTKFDVYNPISQRPQIILLNKVDDRAAKDLAELAADEFNSRGLEVYLTSATTHEGLKEFKEGLSRMVSLSSTLSSTYFDSENSDLSRVGGSTDDLQSRELVHDFSSKNLHGPALRLDNRFFSPEHEAILPVLRPTPLKASKTRNGEFEIAKKGGEVNPYWEVTGDKLRTWVLQTDFGNDEAVGYLSDRLAKIGVEDELAKRGAQPHDEVRISMKDTSADYLNTEQEFYIFNYEPGYTAGAEILFSNIRGEDVRLEMQERANRMTRKEKRDQFHARQDERSQTRAQFDAERQEGYWADPSVGDVELPDGWNEAVDEELDEEDF
ncbi:GTPase Obg [Actinomycetota bacterium]|nr:GTPase Obg [Actinomycetota bacterium]